MYYFIIESLKTNLKSEWSYSYLFFHLSSHPSDALKSGISNFLAKKSPFSWIIDPYVSIFWLLCKTNHSNRALSTFSYWQPRNFLVLGALSSSPSKIFSLFFKNFQTFLCFLIYVEIMFLGTPNVLAASLFVMPFSMCDRMSHFSFKVFVFSLRLTFVFWRQWEQKPDFFSFTVEIFVLIQIRIYSRIRKWNSNM